MTYPELIEKIEPYARLPRGYKWTDLSEPTCPHCKADLDNIGVSRLPQKTGLRGNPTLICRCCGTQWAFPKLRVGGPANAQVGLSERHIMAIYEAQKRLGDSAEAHQKALNLEKTYIPEIRAILRISPETRLGIETSFGKTSVEDLAKLFHVSVPTVTALYRGWVVRERSRAFVR